MNFLMIKKYYTNYYYYTKYIVFLTLGCIGSDDRSVQKSDFIIDLLRSHFVNMGIGSLTNHVK